MTQYQLVTDRRTDGQLSDSYVAYKNSTAIIPPTKEEVNVLPVFVCLLVCLLARLLENACMDLDEMLRVDRCRDMDELINF